LDRDLSARELTELAAVVASTDENNVDAKRNAEQATWSAWRRRMPGYFCLDDEQASRYLDNRRDLDEIAGRLTEADWALRQIISRSPQQSAAHLNLARLRWRAKRSYLEDESRVKWWEAPERQLREIVSNYDRAIELGDADLSVCLERVGALLELGSRTYPPGAEALDAARSVDELPTSTWWDRFVRGFLSHQISNVISVPGKEADALKIAKKALEDLNSVVEEHTEFWPARYLRGLARINVGSRVRRDAEKAAEGDLLIQDGFTDIKYAFECQGAGWQQWLKLGNVFMAVGNKEEALVALNEAARVAPDREDVWLQLATFHAFDENWREAAKAAERILEIQRRDDDEFANPQTFGTAARYWLMADSMADYQRICQLYLERVTAKDVPEHVQLACWSCLLADPGAESRDKVRALLAETPRPQTVGEWAIAAALALRDGNTPAAVSALQEALKVNANADAPQLWLLSALVLARNDNFDAARQAIERARPFANRDLTVARPNVPENANPLDAATDVYLLYREASRAVEQAIEPPAPE
jgi:tetratricopeptide (TPR) repeat protein